MLGGTEHLNHVHWTVIPEASTHSLDVTFSTGIWAVVQVYLQLLLNRDKAGFVQTLLVGNSYPLWG